MENNITGYELSRNWFDWCFENPELISPNHTAMYFFIIEHCNRLGWKEKFGLPTEMTKDAIGIKNYKTFANTFHDLINWGFVRLIQKSKNQYSANIIALVENTKANTKALYKASLKHTSKQVQSIVDIDKLNNQTTIEQNNDINIIYDLYPLKCFVRNTSTNKCSKNKEQIKTLLKTYTKEQLSNVIVQYSDNCKKNDIYIKNFGTFLNQLPLEYLEIKEVKIQKSTKELYGEID